MRGWPTSLIRALHRAVEENFAENHGRIRGQQTALLALGKLGGREMTATSDLDLIMVYDFDAEHPQSDGARPLYGAQYFARLTQRLISALTSQTNYGALYQVDMRLRPSGRSGPVATSIEAFASYQETEAWTWEHMALTRARVVSGPPGFAAACRGGHPRRAVPRARSQRRRRPTSSRCGRPSPRRRARTTRWDLKYAAGGLIDLEFIAQYLQLVHAAEHPEILDTNTARVLDKAWRLGLLSAEEADVLRPAVRLYHNLTQILRLCLPGPFDPKTAGAGLLGLLCRAADLPNFATLDAHLSETQQRVRASFNRILGARLTRATPVRLRASSRSRSATRGGNRRGARRDRLHGSPQRLEVLRPRRRVLLFHPLLVGDGLLLHELDIQRAAVQVVFVENVFAAPRGG